MSTGMGARIVRAREARGLTLSELAEAVHQIDKSKTKDGFKGMISKLEHDKLDAPGIPLLGHISQILNVSLDWLWYGTGEAPDYVPPHAANEYIGYRIRKRQREQRPVPTLTDVAKEMGREPEYVRSVVGGRALEEADLRRWAEYFIRNADRDRSLEKFRTIVEEWWLGDGKELTRIADDPGTDPNKVRSEVLFTVIGHGVPRWSVLNVLEENLAAKHRAEAGFWFEAFVREAVASQDRERFEREALETISRSKAALRDIAARAQTEEVAPSPSRRKRVTGS